MSRYFRYLHKRYTKLYIYLSVLTLEEYEFNGFVVESNSFNSPFWIITDFWLFHKIFLIESIKFSY